MDNLARNTHAGRQIDPEIVQKMLKMKRIFVDNFGDDKQSKLLQAMIVNSLTNAKRFIVTENKDKADAILRGSTVEKTSKEVHAISSDTSFGVASGGFTSGGGSASGGFGAKGAGIGDSSLNTETIDRASGTIRLVSADGDVLWAATAESQGAKFKGASADVAEKLVTKLMRDLEKLEKK